MVFGRNSEQRKSRDRGRARCDAATRSRIAARTRQARDEPALRAQIDSLESSMTSSASGDAPDASLDICLIRQLAESRDTCLIRPLA
eukprot:4639736-Prymnesium_polylepis.1